MRELDLETLGLKLAGADLPSTALARSSDRSREESRAPVAGPTDAFAHSGTPAPLHASFAELRAALAQLAGDRDVETFTEVAWRALHGLATLSQAGRLRPALYDQRLAMLVDQLGTAPA